MYILAFDIERAGATNEYDTIGIGACVLKCDFDSDSPMIQQTTSIIEVDRLFLPGYFVGTTFEKRCWDEFWSKNQDQLEILKYSGPLTHEQRQKEMIESFQAFRAKWESKASEEGVEYFLASDNSIYDGGFLNLMIEKYTTNLPMPYSAKTQKYSHLIDVHNFQRGLLMMVDSEFKRNTWWGLSNRIRELYKTPSPDVLHDHNPANDAHNIAHDLCVVFGIQSGIWKK